MHPDFNKAEASKHTQRPYPYRIRKPLAGNVLERSATEKIDSPMDRRLWKISQVIGLFIARRCSYLVQDSGLGEPHRNH